MTGIHQLWPDASGPLDTDALVALYESDKPGIRANFVTSVDGAVALDGVSTGLSGPPDKRVFGILRMLSDVVLVGAATLRADDYRPIVLSPDRRRWRLEHGRSEYPTLVVVGRGSDLPAHPAVARAPVPARVIGLDDLPSLCDRHVLCEGGPTLFGELLAADLVDELCLTVSPLLAGAATGPEPGRIAAGPRLPVPRQMSLCHALAAEGMLLLRYRRRVSPGPPA
jgi:riboflavin biosynthesis pyrimidine reductase